MSQVRPADADDAGGLGSLCQKYPQLMLMMLAGWVFASRVRPADGSKVRPADARDACSLGSLRPKCTQLMLMMLAVRGLCVQSAPSRC